MQFYSLCWLFTLEHLCTLFHGGKSQIGSKYNVMTHTAASSKAFVLFSGLHFLVNWTGHVQRLSVSLQFVCSVYRDVLLLKIAKIRFYTGELFSSVSMYSHTLGLLPPPFHTHLTSVHPYFPLDFQNHTHSQFLLICPVSSVIYLLG